MQTLTIEYICQESFLGVDPARLAKKPAPARAKENPALVVADLVKPEPIKLALIQNANLNSTTLELSGLPEIIEGYDRPSLEKQRLQSSDVLVTTRFKSFWCAVVGIPKLTHPYVAGSNLYVLRANSAITSGEYLTTYLRSKAGLNQIAAIARPVKTTSPYQGWLGLNKEDVLGLEIPIPSLDQQQQAISLFRAIDALQQKHRAEMQKQIDQFNQLFLE